MYVHGKVFFVRGIVYGISNAAYLSAWTNDWAEIPTDEALFEKHLKELCENESCSKK